MTSLSLPYMADAKSLPATLPTVQEIESATEALNITAARKVVAVGNHFVVKYGFQVDPLEGQTMLSLAQSTSVPVPQVYAIFQDFTKQAPTTFIVMERIQGSSLEQKWPRMDSASKQTVALQLRNIFTNMRSIPSPGGYCSVGRQKLPDELFWTNDPAKPYAGPFDTEAELNNAMIQKYTADGLSKYKASFYTQVFADVYRRHEPTFSHEDFQRKNIMVRKRENRQPDDAPPELVIVDWEFSGWYPSYWEYARAVFACGRWDDDWSEWVVKILEPFHNECAWMEILLRELWG